MQTNLIQILITNNGAHISFGRSVLLAKTSLLLCSQNGKRSSTTTSTQSEKLNHIYIYIVKLLIEYFNRQNNLVLY